MNFIWSVITGIIAGLLIGKIMLLPNTNRILNLDVLLIKI